MKLINCPECAFEINDGDSKCNNCGFPINKILKTAPANRSEKQPSRVISKDWVKYHTFTSIGLSFLLGLLVYLDGYGSSYDTPYIDTEETHLWEFVITSLLTASFYWFAVLCAYSAIKAYRDKLINRGWLRLHVILSIIGGGALFLFQLLISYLMLDLARSDELFPCFFWPVFYWVALTLHLAIIRFNNDIIKASTLSNISKLMILCSLLLIVYLSTFTYPSTYNGVESIRMSYDPFETTVSAAAFYLLTQLILFSVIWIKHGFQEEK